MGKLADIGNFLLSGLARVLPRRLSYLLGETLGVVSFLLFPQRRRNLAANLRAVTGGGPGRMPTGLVLAATVNFARSVVETLLIPYMDDAYVARHVAVTDRAGLPSLAGAGRGVILVTAHLGSWEMGGFALARMGHRLTTVAGTQFSPSLSPLAKAMKARYGIAVVSAQRGTLTLFRALRRGEAVALHIDGDQFLGGLETTFFGRPTVMPRGPAALALRTGAALVPAFAIRTSRDRIHIYVEEPIPGDGEDEADLTRRLLAVVEAYIKRHPEQWCMFRPFWGSPP